MNATKASRAGVLTWVAAGAILTIVAWLLLSTFPMGRGGEQEYWPRDPTEEEQSAIAAVASDTGLARYTSQVYDDHPSGDIFVVTDARGIMAILRWDQLTPTRLELAWAETLEYPVVFNSYGLEISGPYMGGPIPEPIPNAGTWLVYEDHMVEVPVDK